MEVGVRMLMFPLTSDQFFEVYGLRVDDPMIQEGLGLACLGRATMSSHLGAYRAPNTHLIEECIHFTSSRGVCDFAVQNKMFCIQSNCVPPLLEGEEDEEPKHYRIYHPRFPGGFAFVEAFQGLELTTLSPAFHCFYSGVAAAEEYQSVPFVGTWPDKPELPSVDSCLSVLDRITVESVQLCRDLEFRSWREHLQLLQHIQKASVILSSFTKNRSLPITEIKGLLKPFFLDIVPRAHFGLSRANALHALTPSVPYYGPDAYALRGGEGLNFLHRLEESFHHTAYCLDQKLNA